MVGEDSVFKSPIPPSQHWFFLASLKHVAAHIKQVVKEVFSTQIKFPHNYVPGGCLVGQHIDRCIIMPRCACASEVYGSVFVCVSVCLSV